MPRVHRFSDGSRENDAPESSCCPRCRTKRMRIETNEWFLGLVQLSWNKSTLARRHSRLQRNLAWEHLGQVWSSGFPQRNRWPAGWLLSGHLVLAEKNKQKNQNTKQQCSDQYVSLHLNYCIFSYERKKKQQQLAIMHYCKVLYFSGFFVVIGKKEHLQFFPFNKIFLFFVWNVRQSISLRLFWTNYLISRL